MVKVISLITRRKGMSHDECVRYHREVHTRIFAAAFRGKIRRYFTYYVEEALAHPTLGKEKATVPFDMIVVVYFENKAWKKLDAILKSPDGQKVRDSDAKFMDQTKLVSLVCEENDVL